jgi:hypothetical protein
VYVGVVSKAICTTQADIDSGHSQLSWTKSLRRKAYTHAVQPGAPSAFRCSAALRRAGTCLPPAHGSSNKE